MEALLGFSLGFWDYVTFLTLFVLTAAGLGLGVFVLGLPGRIAIARNHPEAEAVYLMGWVGFLAASVGSSSRLGFQADHGHRRSLSTA
ncbi:DUF3302 domain-containing protein [Bradyrhizobium sp. LA7.1]|uniref:DUF3302 domain-containing protein n=1 Tax=unclassified Bradyrhizobium TaxID=2631580 RepID=UPI0033996C56